MKKTASTIVDNIEAHSLKWMGIATVVMVCYLMVGAVCGLDVCDNGFYMTFYDNIFQSPRSVEYNFMYYLSGVTGGALLRLFPAMGLLGMRVAGIIAIMAAMWVAFLLLRHIVPSAAIILAMLVITCAFIDIPVTLGNDILATLLWVIASAALYKAMERDSGWLMLLAGAVIGINIFSRLPNVLGLGLLVLMPVAGKATAGRQAMSWGRVWAMALLGFLGAVLGAGAVVAMMHALGHLDIFLDNMADLHALAADGKTGSTHSLAYMVVAQLDFYKGVLWVAVKYGIVAWIYIKVGDWCTWKPVRWLLRTTCLVALVWLTMRLNIVRPVWAMAFLGCFYVIVMGNQQQRMAAWLGLYMILVFPMGSDGYAHNQGTLLDILALPLAASLWIRNHGRDLLVAFALVCAFKMVTGAIYFDEGPVWQKTATVHNPRVAGILTTPQRAAVLNHMLAGIKPWVGAGDTLMVYGSAPIINYMTATRPDLGCSWPELLSPALLQHKLATASHGPLPIVLRQKFNTIGQQWGPPTTDLAHYNVKSPFLDDAKLHSLNTFLHNNHYRVAYSDPYFILYLPPAQHR